jgi:hypothetical protein
MPTVFMNPQETSQMDRPATSPFRNEIVQILTRQVDSRIPTSTIQLRQSCAGTVEPHMTNRRPGLHGTGLRRSRRDDPFNFRHE